MIQMHLPCAVVNLIARLNHAGFHAYVVGGSVRDALRGLTPHDYDMTTDATPDEMKGIFADLRVIETGIKHGTLTVLSEGTPYEITTYRVDGDYRDHRHPDRVTFTRSLREDLARRDFTMNAIAYHPTEGYIDPFDGMKDIDNHLIRAVGDPARRFHEDALRILRGLRFAATLGYEIEAHTAHAMDDTCNLIPHVSAERIREELTKLLVGEYAADVIRRFHTILSVRLHPLAEPEEKALQALRRLPADPVLRLTALVQHRVADAHEMDALMRDMKFDNASRLRATALVALRDGALPTDSVAILNACREYTTATFDDLCTLRAALADTTKEEAAVAAIRVLLADLLAEGAPYRISDLAINGSDIIAHSTLRGSAVGDALHTLLLHVISGKVENTREELLHYLSSMT